MRHDRARHLNRTVRAVLASATLLGAGAVAAAGTYPLPGEGGAVVGTESIVHTSHSDTLSDLALRYNQGYREMRVANPGVDPWLPGEGTAVVIPSRYVLPDTPREGVVVNVPEMRLYYYPKTGPGEPPVVLSHPISIGRQEWTTPHGVTRVVAKAKDPSWYPPESIREEHAQRGDPLPRIVPAGPANPLGAYALRLGLPGYLIHGTNRPFGLGMRVTHGCIRMYPEDIERLFFAVDLGTPVRIVNQPYKVALDGNEIYLEVHPPLVEDAGLFDDQFSHVVDRVIAAAAGRHANIDWNALQAAMEAKRGIPVVIGELAERTRPAVHSASRTSQPAAPAVP